MVGRHPYASTHYKISSSHFYEPLLISEPISSFSMDNRSSLGAIQLEPFCHREEVNVDTQLLKDVTVS